MRLAIGIILIFAGTIWVLQGFDVTFAPESFMTGSRWCVLWGGGAAIVGALMIWWHRRSS
jgi:hypothetical protein